MKHSKIALGVSVFVFFVFFINNVFGAVTVTPANSASISADTVGGAYTSLTGPVISEGATRDIGNGTIILNAPSGFVFDTGGTAPTVLVTRIGGSGPDGRNINNLPSGSIIAVTRTATTLTIIITARSAYGVTDSLTWQNVRVRPTAGAPLASGNILKTGTSAISGVVGATNFGTLTEVAGAKNKLSFTTQPSSTALVYSDFTVKPVVVVRDQFDNIITSDNSSAITNNVVLAGQVCGGTAGSGTLTSTPVNGSAVTAGQMTYTAMQYSVVQNIALCATSAGVTSALSNSITIQSPVPITSSISPISKNAGDDTFVLTINGSNFTSGSVVQFNDEDRATSFVNSNQLTAVITAEDIQDDGAYDITVVNPTPGGGTSNSQTLSVYNPIAFITSISPESKNVGDGEFTLTIRDSNFISAHSIARLDGSDLVTTFINPSEITATVPASIMTSAGTHTITVYTSGFGGGISNGKIFTVNNPLPIISSINPDTKIINDAPFSMTVTGSNFVSSSVIEIDGVDLVTTFIDSTSLMATVEISADEDEPESSHHHNVTVINPGPGGGTSNTKVFTVNNPAPGAIFLDISNKMVSSPEFTLTVTDSSFLHDSVVRFNGLDKVTTLVSPTILTAIIPASDLITAGIYPITVYQPGPGGGVSPEALFQVDNPVPAVTSIAPDSSTAGDLSFTMIVTGSNFVPSSTAVVGGDVSNDHNPVTTYLNSTTLSVLVAMPSSETWKFHGAHTHNISIVNPTPGGGTSNSKTLTINNPTPIISTLSDYSKMKDDSEFTMTITGSDFVENAVVRFDGVDMATTPINTTTLTAVIPASSLTTARTVSVVVYQPGPGGGSSNIQVFTVNNPTPIITSMNQTSKKVGSSGFTLIIGGTGFLPTSLVHIEGFDRETTYLNSTHIKADILTSDLASAGSFSISVHNPAPGGGTSNNMILEVEGPGGSVPSFLRLLWIEQRKAYEEELHREQQVSPQQEELKPTKKTEYVEISNPNFELVGCDNFSCRLNLRFGHTGTHLSSHDESQFYIIDKMGNKTLYPLIHDDGKIHHFVIDAPANSEVSISVCENQLNTNCVKMEMWTPAHIHPGDITILPPRDNLFDYRLDIEVSAINNMTLEKSGVMVSVLERPQGILPGDVSRYKTIFEKTVNHPDYIYLDVNARDYLVRLTPINARGEKGKVVEKSLNLKTKNSTLDSMEYQLIDIQSRIAEILKLNIIGQEDKVVESDMNLEIKDSVLDDMEYQLVNIRSRFIEVLKFIISGYNI